MFTTLLESGIRESRHERWLSASTSLHAVLLLGAVTLTPERTTETAPPVVGETLVWVAPERPVTPQHSAPETDRDASFRMTGRRLPTIKDIVGIVDPSDALLTSPSDIGRPDETTNSGVADSFPDGVSSDGNSALSAAQLDKPALPIPGNSRPLYPEMLRSAGIDGSVMVRFIIDTTGAVERNSVTVSRSDHDLFASAVRAALLKHRFLAAESGGRKVRMLVEQRFDFAIEHR